MQTLNATDTLYSPLAEDPDLTDLVLEFVNEVPGRIGRLQRSAADKNWTDVARIAHQLKGAAGSYGFGDVTPFANRVEDTAKAQAPEEQICAALLDLADICSRLRAGVPE